MKRVIITNSTVIRPLRNIRGPILTPTPLEDSKLERLIIEGYKVFEVKANKRVRLDLTNYQSDNFPEVKPAPVKQPQTNNQKQQNKRNNNRNQNKGGQNNQNQHKNNNQRVEDPIIKK